MKIEKIRSCQFGATTIGFSLLLGGLASGQTFSGEVLTATNGTVSIGEGEVEGDVFYYVDVLAPVSIHAVALSFEADIEVGPGFPEGEGPPLPIEGEGGEGPGEPFGGDYPFSGGGFIGEAQWNVNFFSRADWNVGFRIFIGEDFYLTSDYGSFESLFGEVDNFVAVYADTSGVNPLNEFTDADQENWGESVPPTFFRFAGEASTEGLFIDGSGGTVATTNPVPEPSATLLGALGLLALGIRRRAS